MSGRSEIKKRSKECLKRNYLKCFLFALLFKVILEIPIDFLKKSTLTFTGVGFSISLSVFAVLLAVFILSPFSVYTNKFYLLTYKNKDEKIGFKEVINKKSIENYPKFLLVMLWNYLWVLIWSLLFVIPGIIKSMSYALASYIAIDNPKIGVRKSLKLSMRMMKGHKMDLFILYLSFIGWALLTSLASLLVNLPFYLIGNLNPSIFEVVISSILNSAFVFPYLILSQSGFYKELRDSSLEKGIVTLEELNENNEEKEVLQDID